METYELNLSQLSRFLRKKGWRIALTTILCAGLVLAGSLLFLKPQYGSKITFCVHSSNLAASRDLVESCMVILNTRETLTQVCSQAQTSASWEDLDRSLHMERMQDTEFFQVTVMYSDAEEANALAAAIGEILPQRVSEILTETTLKTVDTPVTANESSDPDYVSLTITGGLLGFSLGSMWTTFQASRREEILQASPK